VRYVLGADPGASGAAALVRIDARPTLVRAVNIGAEGIFAVLRSLLGDHDPRTVVAYVEGGLTVPRDAKKLRSVAAYQRAVGALRASVEALGLADAVEVSPQAWQRALGVSAYWGASRTVRKNATREIAASRLAPGAKFTVRQGDAVAIAVYGAIARHAIDRTTEARRAS
jgi:hypothetical protein